MAAPSGDWPFRPQASEAIRGKQEHDTNSQRNRAKPRLLEKGNGNETLDIDRQQPRCGGAGLVDNARLFALLGIETCDALIAVFDAKYTYNFWRPYHAIRLADTDGNPLTEPDSTWTSLVFPPRHQEYPSAHAIVTGGFMRILARELGDEHTFTLSAPSITGFSWTFNRFSDAAAQVKEARIWAGIHYRNSVNVGGVMGVELGDHIVENLLLPLHDEEGEGNRDHDHGHQ